MIRENTKEEVREMVLAHIKHLAHYWATAPNAGTVKDRCEGVAFSILTMMDGCAGGMPAFDLVVRPHPDDKAFHIAEGENWMPDGMAINDDCQLHELFYAEERAQRAQASEDRDHANEDAAIAAGKVQAAMSMLHKR